MRLTRMHIREWEFECIKAGSKTSITRLMRPQPAMADRVLYGGGPYDGWVCVNSREPGLRLYGRGPCLPGDYLSCVCYPLPLLHEINLVDPLKNPTLCLLVKTVHAHPIHDVTESDAPTATTLSIPSTDHMPDMLTSDWFVFNRMSLFDFLQFREMCGRVISGETFTRLNDLRIKEDAARKAAPEPRKGKT